MKYEKKSAKRLAAVTAFLLAVSQLSACSQQVQQSDPDASGTASASENSSSVTSTASEASAAQSPQDSTHRDSVSAYSGDIVSVTADSMQGRLAVRDTAFTVVTKEKTEPDLLKNALALNGTQDFTIERSDDLIYKLKPVNALPENSVAVISLKDDNGGTACRWAFQTEAVFEVKNSYPQGDYTVIDSGIEIQFTSPVGELTTKDIEIFPVLKGKVETRRNTLYFIPSQNMKEFTTYTVTVKKGAVSADGAALAEDHSFTFTTSGDVKYQNGYCYDEGMTETFVKGDPAVIKISCSESMKKDEFSLKLYRYGSAEAYGNALKAYADSGIPEESYTFETDGLEEVYNETKKLITGEERWDPNYLLLPDDLDEGYYMAEVRARYRNEEFLIQRHIQINPVSVYSSALGDQVQFFINDTATGKAASGAKIKLHTSDGTVSASTDNDGVAKLDYNAEEGSALLEITSGDDVYWDIFDLKEDYGWYYAGNGNAYAEEFYTYLYTDREIYKTTDTINVWGVIRPRKIGTEAPKELTLRLGWSDEMSREIPITLNDDGTFKAELSYEDALFDYGTHLSVVSGDKELCWKYLRINDYVKPNYEFTTDIPVYAVSPQTIPVPVSVDAELYDGTAADGLTFKATGWDAKSCDPEKLVTDDKGHAECEVLFNDRDSWYPQYISLSLELTGVENEYTDAYLSTAGFFRDTMLETDFDKESRQLEITTSLINYSALEKDDPIYSEETYKKLRGEAADTAVNARVIRSYSVKTPRETYYDYLLKENVTRYDYEYREECVAEYDITTVNGKYTFKDLPLDHEDSGYSVEFRWNDTQGRATKETVNLWYKNYYNDSTYKSYSFASDSTEFKEDGVIKAEVVDANGEKPKDGRFFTQLHAKEFIRTKVFDSADVTMDVTDECIPTCALSGAYFDGKHVYPVSSNWEQFSYDPENRKLEVKITSDKEKYAPGEKVKLTVEVTDINGAPVKNAAVNLSAADEAVFAVMPQYADPLEAIYADVTVYTPVNYRSYIQHSFDSMNAGEMGGGGDDGGARREFLDTAAFLCGNTDDKGQAVFEFELPDNVTSWRATASAVYEKAAGELYAGASKQAVISTLPLFIEAVMPSEILEGDSLAVSARCFGEHTGDESITIELKGEGVNESRTVPSGQGADFGKPAKGDYTVTFSAESGGNSDSMELPLKVTDSMLETRVTRSFDLAEGVSINPERYPVCLTFFNSEYMLYTDVLFKISRQAASRLDMRIASAFAMKELGFYTEEEYKSQLTMVTPYGLASLNRNAEPDTVLTAKICAADPDITDKKSVTEVMYNILDNKESDAEDVSSAYLALASYGEPVLTEIISLLETSADSLEQTDGLRLTAALALLGDNASAEKYYAVFASEITETKDDEGNISISVNGEYPVEATQTAIMTAAVLGLPEADGMARYLVNTRQVYDSFALELMVYLKHYTPEKAADASFSYTLDGETVKVDLDRHFGTHLEFGKEQLEKADFKVVSGGVYTVASYVGKPEENDGEPELTVKKTMTGDLVPGGVVTVKIQVTGGDPDHSYFVVDDVIPSCGRYDRTYLYYARRNGQRVTLYTDKDGVAEYQFRITCAGEFVAESAAARSCDGKWGVSERDVLKVAGNEA